jgi:hypothetical protein
VADLPAVIAHENAISKSLDGRSVFDDARPPKRQAQVGQMALFSKP